MLTSPRTWNIESISIDTYDDEFLGGLDGTVYYRFIPERFAWSIEDNFAQIAVNGLAVDTPDNRQNLNYFTTGPDIILPLGARTALEVSGRYSDVVVRRDTGRQSRISRGRFRCCARYRRPRLSHWSVRKLRSDTIEKICTRTTM